MGVKLLPIVCLESEDEEAELGLNINEEGA